MATGDYDAVTVSTHKLLEVLADCRRFTEDHILPCWEEALAASQFAFFEVVLKEDVETPLPHLTLTTEEFEDQAVELLHSVQRKYEDYVELKDTIFQLGYLFKSFRRATRNKAAGCRMAESEIEKCHRELATVAGLADQRYIYGCYHDWLESGRESDMNHRNWLLAKSKNGVLVAPNAKTYLRWQAGMRDMMSKLKMVQWAL